MNKRLLFSIIIYITTMCCCHAQSLALWGMTTYGGTNNGGTIFKINASGTETVTYNFGNGASDGKGPWGTLVKATNGLYYGVTWYGGSNSAGTIFSYDISTGIETPLHEFDGADGQLPTGSLIQVNDSMLYGTTWFGGTNEGGIIFSYNINTGIESVLHNFGNGTDGANPFCTLTQATNGLLYGVTYQGGANGDGIIFTYNITTGFETDVHDFSDTGSKSPIFEPLIQLNDSLLYGTSQYGGAYKGGTLFSYNIITDSVTDLYDFGNGTDGKTLDGGLMRASNGLLYGLTLYGGAYGSGVIYSYNLATNTETVVHNFGSGTDGQIGFGGIIQACNGLLYGMTSEGGDYDDGIIFTYNIATSTETDIHDFSSDSDGAGPNGNDFLEVDSIFPITIAPQSTSICSGASVSLIVSGGTTYSWTPAATLNDSTGDSVIANPTVTTIYSVSSFNGCSTTTDTVTIIPAAPIPIYPQSQSVCPGQSVVLSVPVSGTDYLWSPSSTLSSSTGVSVIATPTATTTYTVTGTDSLGCSSTGSDVVNLSSAPNIPTITISVTGDSLISSAKSYNQWYFDNQLINDSTGPILIITGHAKGWYSVTVTNPANGCSTLSDSTTSVNQLSANGDQLSIYPNPTSGQFTIKLNNNQKIGTIAIYNVIGETVYQSILNNSQNEISLNSLSAGLYFVYLKSDERVDVAKVVVTK